MYLNKIEITQFKNLSKVSLEPSEYLNAFVGLNGMGKTNILDSVHYICLSKSAFTRIEKNNIQENKDFFRLKGYFLNHSKSDVVIKLKLPNVKVIEEDGKEVEKISDHIGEFPLVIITPDDKVQLLNESSQRRNFINKALSQTDRTYLRCLLEYNKALIQRNTYLKSTNPNNINSLLLQAYDVKMQPLAAQIYKTRKLYIEELSKLFHQIYEEIAAEKEIYRLEYSSLLAEKDYLALAKENFQKDFMTGRSNAGIHKDDLLFFLNDKPLKNFASQGQIKSFVLSLKLAEFSYIKNQKKINPILILDDIFDKLDNTRLHRLVTLLADRHFGQVFISDTEFERIFDIFAKTNIDYKIFKVDNGAVIDEIKK